jgi:bifunctional non-homologous end joining protein LigD
VTPPATRDHHPSRRSPRPRAKAALDFPGRLVIPRESNDVALDFGGRIVQLTNLNKVFWRELGRTKGDLLQYYADVSTYLLPHLKDRAMVMKRYPTARTGEFFFMKRAPSPRPGLDRDLLDRARSGNVIDFPMIQDLPALLWVVNLGCIDLNQWYARCDDVDRPDYCTSTSTRCRARRGGRSSTPPSCSGHARPPEDPSFAKTTGSRGIHVYVPIVRGPTQKQVWTFAKEVARVMETRDPKLVTAVLRRAERPARARSRGLQPERLGEDARVDLLGPPAAPRDGLDARDVGGDLEGRRAGRLPDGQRAGEVGAKGGSLERAPGAAGPPSAREIPVTLRSSRCLSKAS